MKNFRKHLVFTAYNTELSRWIWALQYVISMDPATSLKNYSHLERRLIDMPHIFSESLDNSEQNLHRCIWNFFFENFLGRALIHNNNNYTLFQPNIEFYIRYVGGL